MKILQFSKKGIHMDTTENFYIYKETIKGNQVIDKHTVTPIKYLKQYLKEKVIWLGSPSQYPTSTALQIAVTHEQVYIGPNANVTITLTFIRHIKILRRYSLLHSRIYEYINIFTFDYC
jgi:hypothetical protein